MKKYLFIAILIELIIILIMCFRYRSLSDAYEVSINNNKAYEQNNLQFEISMRQLGMKMDSISSVCMRVKDSLKIKDKKVKEIVYIKSGISKIDTVTFTDTIFVENTSKDTLLSDNGIRLGYI